MPNYAPIDYAKLRQALEGKFGIQPASPLDVAARVPEESQNVLREAPTNLWNWLSKTPVQDALATPAKKPIVPPIQTPDAGIGIGGGTPAAAASPSLGPNQFRLPSGYDPTKSVTGTASYGGPKLNQPSAALSGLQATQTGTGGYDIPTEEMYKQTFASPETVAPGASQWMGKQLKDTIGDEEFRTALEQAKQQSIESSMAGVNPAGQAQAELAARQKAYPAVGQGAQAATIREAGPEARGMGNYYNELAKTLGGGGVGTGLGSNISGISKSGVTFRNPNSAMNQAQLTQLTNMRRLVQQQGATDWLGRPTEAAKGLDQTLSSILATYPVDPDIKDVVRHIMTNPATERLTDLGQIYEAIGVDPAAVSPEENQQVQQLLSLLRGSL